MKNIKTISLVIIAALVGMGAGYLVFGNKNAAVPPMGHDHAQMEESATNEQIWTCSMHPQIRQNEPGQCPICGMDLIPLDEASSSGDGNPLVLEMTEEAAKLANIQTVEVGSSAGASVKTISLTGKIEADERLAASQVAHVPGRIEQLFVTFTGENIRKGQKLATIYSPELVSAQKELIEAKKWADTRPQLLEAVRQKLRFWKIPETTIQEIESTGELQPNVNVFAEQSGVVLKRRVSVGDYVKEGSVLFDVTNLSRLWVLFDAYEEDLADIRLGDRVKFTVASLPDREFSAKITFIDPLINPQTRTASLRAEVTNVSGLLKPEMLVRGKVEANVKGPKAALVVPRTAVLWTGPRSVVYVKVPDATVPSYEFREVKIGDAVGDGYLVLEGLEPGERVVVNGAFVIDAAAQLNNMSSMMNRNVRLSKDDLGVPDYTDETPDAFRQQLMEVVHQYLPLKEALVGTDPAAAKTAAEGLLAALEKVEMSLLKGDAHMFWMEKLKAMQSHGKSITGSDDVEEQRKQFSFLTEALIDALKAFGTTDENLYVQYCPMAFNNQGADWLSTEEVIKNPYFGDKMLTCGSVKLTFPLERRTVPAPASNPNQMHHH